MTAVLLAGCASRPPLPDMPVKQDLTTLQSWQITGKLGFKSPEKNGSAFIDWAQSEGNYLLRLTGPFGAGATRIEGNASHAVLSQAGEEDILAPSGEELTRWLFGWPLPVTQMASWIKGSPAASPAPDNVTTTPRGLLESLNQSGWRLSYSDYSKYGNRVLPGKIKGSLGSYSFVLVIKQWSIPRREEP